MMCKGFAMNNVKFLCKITQINPKNTFPGDITNKQEEKLFIILKNN
jgi:hypothetical protein